MQADAVCVLCYRFPGIPFIPSFMIRRRPAAYWQPYPQEQAQACVDELRLAGYASASIIGTVKERSEIEAFVQVK